VPGFSHLFALLRAIAGSLASLRMGKAQAMDQAKLNALIELFQQTAEALGQPSCEPPHLTNTPWPLAHAGALVERLPAVLGMKIGEADLVACLVRAHDEYCATLAPEVGWSRFCATYFMERLAGSRAPQRDRLALYYFDTCSFCRLVRREIDRLGIEVELRDIYADPRHRRDLVAARGRPTVPVLRITSGEEDDRWMPESRDIIRYLQATYR